jgi:hypothetical protein
MNNPIIQIHITEFAGYDAEAFRDFLQDSEEEQVCISIPKQTALYQNTHLQIAIEYTHMLLAGQKLHDLAEDFLYELPRLDAKERFVFYVRNWQRAALAELLALLAAFQAKEDLDSYVEFDQEAAELLSLGNEVMEYACYDFYVLASNFLLMEDSEKLDRP